MFLLHTFLNIDIAEGQGIWNNGKYISNNWPGGGIFNIGSGLSEILETPYGYFFVDEKRGKIVQYLGGSKTEIISEQVDGKPNNMGQWFREHIPFKILRQIPALDVDNKYKGIGFNLWYDERQKRVFFTKRDYVVNPIADLGLFS